MNDIDLLISNNSFEKSIDMFKNLGYKQFKTILKDDHCLNLGKGIINIGLHREITVDHRYYGVTNHTSFNELYKKSIKLKNFSIPDHTTFFYHLIVHLVYSHGFVGLVQLTDIIKFYFKFHKYIDLNKMKFLLKNSHMEKGFLEFINLLSNEFNLHINYDPIPKESLLTSKIAKYAFNKNFSMNINETEADEFIPLFMCENFKDSLIMISKTLNRRIFRKTL
jgi:hypothetical protein